MIENFTTEAFAVDATGANLLYSGDMVIPIATDAVVVFNGNVVVQEGAIVPAPFDLEFNHIGVCSIETIADVIARAYELFRAVRRDLRYVADEAQQRIAELESEIAIAAGSNNEDVSSKIRELKEEMTRANCRRLAPIDDAAVVALNDDGSGVFGPRPALHGRTVELD